MGQKKRTAQEAIVCQSGRETKKQKTGKLMSPSDSTLKQQEQQQQKRRKQREEVWLLRWKAIFSTNPSSSLECRMISYFCLFLQEFLVVQKNPVRFKTLLLRWIFTSIHWCVAACPVDCLFTFIQLPCLQSFVDRLQNIQASSSNLDTEYMVGQFGLLISELSQIRIHVRKFRTNSEHRITLFDWGILQGWSVYVPSLKELPSLEREVIVQTCQWTKPQLQDYQGRRMRELFSCQGWFPEPEFSREEDVVLQNITGKDPSSSWVEWMASHSQSSYSTAPFQGVVSRQFFKSGLESSSFLAKMQILEIVLGGRKTDMFCVSDVATCLLEGIQYEYKRLDYLSILLSKHPKTILAFLNACVVWRSENEQYLEKHHSLDRNEQERRQSSLPRDPSLDLSFFNKLIKRWMEKKRVPSHMFPCWLSNRSSDLASLIQSQWVKRSQVVYAIEHAERERLFEDTEKKSGKPLNYFREMRNSVKERKLAHEHFLMVCRQQLGAEKRLVPDCFVEEKSWMEIGNLLALEGRGRILPEHVLWLAEGKRSKLGRYMQHLKMKHVVEVSTDDSEHHMRRMVEGQLCFLQSNVVVKGPFRTDTHLNIMRFCQTVRQWEELTGRMQSILPPMLEQWVVRGRLSLGLSEDNSCLQKTDMSFLVMKNVGIPIEFLDFEKSRDPRDKVWSLSMDIENFLGGEHCPLLKRDGLCCLASSYPWMYLSPEWVDTLLWTWTLCFLLEMDPYACTLSQFIVGEDGRLYLPPRSYFKVFSKKKHQEKRVNNFSNWLSHVLSPAYGSSSVVVSDGCFICDTWSSQMMFWKDLFRCHSSVDSILNLPECRKMFPVAWVKMKEFCCYLVHKNS